MFVKKLVEKASKKKLPARIPVLHVLAVATRNGQIKLFGRDNTQALLQSPSPLPSRFLQFAEGQGVLLNVNTQNQIEVWDIDTKKLCYVHSFQKGITAFSLLQKSLYIYVGDSSGNVSLLKLDLAQRCLADMPYWIPFAESYGSAASLGNDVEVIFVSPQPMAESNRVLVIFRDGVMSLWDIKSSKVVSISGKSMQQQSHQESKTVASACWVLILNEESESRIVKMVLPLTESCQGIGIGMNEDNASSGNPITSLQFDMPSSILISGEKSGMVHIITFKKDSTDNIFSFLNAKQGDNYNVRSIKLKGSVTTTSSISKSKHFAAGTEKGIGSEPTKCYNVTKSMFQVSVINVEDATVLYQKQFECRISGGIASLQFEIYSHNGYDKDILIIAMEDSSMFILEEETGKLLNPNPVQTDKPSKALLLQMLELSPSDASVSDNHDTVSKESLLLLCTENAIRLFSLSHAIQGIKKIINKKKFSNSCCFASLIHSSSDEIGLMLVFSNGKIEIRSLPDLSLLKDASLRGFVYSRNMNSTSSIACSSDGETILVNGEETYFFSTLCQDDIYRHMDSISTVYRKDNSLREESSLSVKSPKEKKKGLFGMIMKDNKGSKSKESDANGSEQCIETTSEELASLFSSANFAPPSERRNSSLKDEENVELDIDDIDIDDNPQKQKGPHFPGLSKEKINKGLQTLRGKLKPKTEEKTSLGNKKTEDETSVSQVDQIKMKYGYGNATNDDSTSVPKMIGNKLQENMKKLEGINLRAADMATGAQSFSAMAKELLRTTKNEKGTS
nr:unnamed protein product [Digitaria exilis]